MKQAVAYLNLQDVPAEGLPEEVVVSKTNAVPADSLWLLSVSKDTQGTWNAETHSMSVFKGRTHADILLALEGFLGVVIMHPDIPKEILLEVASLHTTLQTRLSQDLDISRDTPS